MCSLAYYLEGQTKLLPAIDDFTFSFISFFFHRNGYIMMFGSRIDLAPTTANCHQVLLPVCESSIIITEGSSLRPSCLPFSLSPLLQCQKKINWPDFPCLFLSGYEFIVRKSLAGRTDIRYIAGWPQ